MPIRIEGDPLLPIGQTFTLRWSTWYRLAYPGNEVIVKREDPVVAKVSRIYSDGDRLIFVCKTVSGKDVKEGREFVLESVLLQDSTH